MSVTEKELEEDKGVDLLECIDQRNELAAMLATVLGSKEALAEFMSSWKLAKVKSKMNKRPV